MSGPRPIKLVDAGSPGAPLVAATIVRGLAWDTSGHIERSWSPGRRAHGPGADLEHAHWDWRNKIDTVGRGFHLVTGVCCDGAAQGLMATQTAARPAVLGPGEILYVDYLETAPRNLKGFVTPPRYPGTGLALIEDAVRRSLGVGRCGRVGLHSLPGAEGFYADRCGMIRVGPDPRHYGLACFGHTEERAGRWLASLEDAR